jgi:transcriptional regulator with XRE-family HTH domain
MSIASRIGKYVAYQRSKNHVSLNAFAKKVGITTSFLLRLEKGKYEDVSFSNLERISKGLDMSVEALLYKCGIVKQDPLPPLAYYLKEKYQFPPDAILFVQLMLKTVKEYYRVQIIEMKRKHKNFYRKRQTRTYH